MNNPAAETAGYQDSKQPYLFQIFFWFPHPVMLFYISQETLCDNGFAKHNDTPFLLHHPFPPIQLTTLRSPCSKTTGNCKFKKKVSCPGFCPALTWNLTFRRINNVWFEVRECEVWCKNSNFSISSGNDQKKLDKLGGVCYKYDAWGYQR